MRSQNATPVVQWHQVLVHLFASSAGSIEGPLCLPKPLGNWAKPNTQKQNKTTLRVYLRAHGLQGTAWPSFWPNRSSLILKTISLMSKLQSDRLTCWFRCVGPTTRFLVCPHIPGTLVKGEVKDGSKKQTQPKPLCNGCQDEGLGQVWSTGCYCSMSVTDNMSGSLQLGMGDSQTQKHQEHHVLGPKNLVVVFVDRL